MHQRPQQPQQVAALIGEAAYRSLPKQQRAELHERLARWMDSRPSAADEAAHAAGCGPLPDLIDEAVACILADREVQS